MKINLYLSNKVSSKARAQRNGGNAKGRRNRMRKNNHQERSGRMSDKVIGTTHKMELCGEMTCKKLTSNAFAVCFSGELWPRFHCFLWIILRKCCFSTVGSHSRFPSQANAVLLYSCCSLHTVTVKGASRCVFASHRTPTVVRVEQWNSSNMSQARAPTLNRDKRAE